MCQSRRSHERIAARSTSKTRAVACPPRPAFPCRSFVFFFSSVFFFLLFPQRSVRPASPCSGKRCFCLSRFLYRYCLTASLGVFHVSTEAQAPARRSAAVPNTPPPPPHPPIVWWFGFVFFSFSLHLFPGHFAPSSLAPTP